MTAVIYARYSSDSQREASIEGQLRDCKDYAEKNGTQATGADGLTTKVLYEVTGGYTWSVPATINFGKNAGGGAQKRTVNATETAGTAPKVFVT